MALQILTVSHDSTTLSLSLEGSLDAVTAPELEHFVTTRLGRGIKTLILDLSKLHFVSSAGLRIFAKTRKTMTAQEGQLCFVNLSPQVQKVFDIVKIVPYKEIFRSDEELDAYLASMQKQVSEDNN